MCFSYDCVQVCGCVCTCVCVHVVCACACVWMCVHVVCVCDCEREREIVHAFMGARRVPPTPHVNSTAKNRRKNTIRRWIQHANTTGSTVVPLVLEPLFPLDDIDSGPALFTNALRGHQALKRWGEILFLTLARMWTCVCV